MQWEMFLNHKLGNNKDMKDETRHDSKNTENQEGCMIEVMKGH